MYDTVIERACHLLVHAQSDASIPPSLKGLHSGLNYSQQSLTSLGSQETDVKMAKVLYDYSVSSFDFILSY